MALPVTIGEQVGTRNSFHGPFISSNGDVFTILVESGLNDNQLVAFRATDPTASFTESDSSNRPAMSDGSQSQLLAVNIVQVGDDLHVLTQNLEEHVYYARFDMSAASNVGAWDDVTTTGGDKDQLVDDTVAPSITDACDLVVRTGQTDVLAVFQWAVETDMGADYERIAFDTKANLTTGAWGGSPAYLGSNGMGVAIDVTGPRAVYEAVSGRTHVVYMEGAGVLRIAHSSISSVDAETSNGDIGENPQVEAGILYPIGHGVLFDRGGTKKIRFPYFDDGMDISVIEFDDSASPSYTFEDGVDGTNDVVVSNSSLVACLAVDGSEVHEIHARASDSDLYTANDADTDTWGTPLSTFIGTVNHISCNVIDRSGLKLAQIIDDGGTIKYDEDILAVAGLTPEEILTHFGQLAINPIRLM